MKTIVYVDGYNLYYGLLRRSPYKWLDLYSLFQNHVLQDADVLEVRYYTAPVLARMCDDEQSPQRQRTYLQALRKHQPCKVSIIEGKLIPSTPIRRMVTRFPELPSVSMVRVHDFVEKKTDVNIACDMLAGAWTQAYEQAVLCSNDSDLQAAFATIKRFFPDIRLGLVAPVASNDCRSISKDLGKYSDWSKLLSPVHLANAQLPEKIHGTANHKPNAWQAPPNNKTV